MDEQQLKRRNQEVKSPPQQVAQPIETCLKPILSESISQDEEAYRWVCDFCGSLVQPLRLEIRERVKFIRKQYCDCPEAQAAKQRWDNEERLHEQQRRAELLLWTAGLNIGKRGQMRFSTWDSARTPTAKQMKQYLWEYAETVSPAGNDNWLYVYGPYGLGKSHLAIAAMCQIVHEHLWKPCMVVWPEHCTQVQQSWNQDNSGAELSEARLWGQMKTAGILLIDDIDKRHPTPWAMGKLYEVIDYRHTREKPTLITANHSLLELSELWGKKQAEVQDSGAAIISRISEQLWATIEFTGQDQRMR